MRRRRRRRRGLLHLYGRADRQAADLRVHPEHVVRAGARRNPHERGARALRDQVAGRLPQARRAVLPRAARVAENYTNESVQ